MRFLDLGDVELAIWNLESTVSCAVVFEADYLFCMICKCLPASLGKIFRGVICTRMITHSLYFYADQSLHGASAAYINYHSRNIGNPSSLTI